jgi:phosphatidylserine/phosphatidylglycerophosphate/cardiolipin synthase-like enzyme
MNEIKIIIGKEYPDVASKLIAEAQKSLKILVFDWRWYPHDPGSIAQRFNNSVVQARQRGIEIKAITPVKETIRRLQEQRIQGKNLDTGKLVHPKLMIIDDKHVIVGSHNFTMNAFTRNYELSVLIKNCDCIDKFLDYFNNLF